VLLTTHIMVEADELCDRVAIINGGKVLACDSPSSLKHRLQSEAIFRLEVSPLNGVPMTSFESIPGVRRFAHSPGDGFSTLEVVLEDESILSPIVSQLALQDIKLRSLQKCEPTLEDVFVQLVGRSMAEVEHGDGK